MVSSRITRPSTRRDGLPQQAWAESSLARHPFQVELRGAPNDLAWPAVCANCGAPAAERVRVRTVFRLRPTRYGPGHRLIGFNSASARIPFCARCVAEHRATTRPPTLAGRVMNVVLTPLVIPIVRLAYLAVVFWPTARATPIGAPGWRLAWGLFAFGALGFLWTTVLAWRTSLPQRIEPQTDVTRACDFSDDVSQPFERERRIYALRNEAFAAAFAEANRSRLWTAEDQARSRMLAAVVGVAVLAAVFGAWLLMKLSGR